jgi:3-ketosteroid 9alpha-monooxygenase subunit A
MTQTADADLARSIDQGALPERYARGWHCLGPTEWFADGKPHQVEIFGTKLVVFQTADGKVNVLDSYCRHLGGDLSQGEVKGNAIACPFHDWRWGGDGRCQSIPYAKRVPMRAKTKTWPTLQKNGQLFVWNDPQGRAPIPEQEPPAIPGIDGDEWSVFMFDSLVIENSNCREIIDNVADMAHFYYVHFAFPTFFKNVFEGHVATQYMASKARPDKMKTKSQYNLEDAVLRSEAAYYGPSYMINYLWNDFNGFTLESVLINTHYPIDQNSFKLMWGVAVKKVPGMDDAAAQKLAGKFTRTYGVGFLQDVEIWKHKSMIENPLLTEEDGPVYQLRRWYQQFYVDVEDIEPDMTDRFEYEVDTDKAVEFWQTEVAENLARQAQEEAEVS